MLFINVETMPRISWAKKNQLIWEIQQQYRTLITYYFTGWVCEYSLHLSHTYIQEWAESFFHETSSEKLSMALSVFFLNVFIAMRPSK